MLIFVLTLRRNMPPSSPVITGSVTSVVFTKWAKKNGFGDACSAADAVMAAKKGKYSDEVRDMANYAKNFGCSTKK